MLRKITSVIFMTLVLSGCATYNPATGRREVLLIDTDTEVNLGAEMAGQISKEMKIADDKVVQRRLDGIGNRIAEVSDRKDLKYSFKIIKDKEFNAFTIPGGTIYVNTGLLEAANDDELAAVIGHEVGHVAARHAAKRMQAVLGYQLVTSIAFGAKAQVQIMEATDVVFNVVVLGYGRKDELLADKLGIKYSSAAGFNPNGMVTFFRKLKKQGEAGGAQLVFLSSHPPIDQRIKLAQEEIEALNKN